MGSERGLMRGSLRGSTIDPSRRARPGKINR
jgi:hypothetical protein